MSDWFVGEIRILPYSRGAPTGWQACDGSLLPISEYDVLYVLLGTTYGGDGQTTFGVPDLRGRVPLHQGNGRGLTPRVIGERAGVDSITLTTQQMGAHAHFLLASTDVGTSLAPADFVLAAVPTSVADPFYATSPAGPPPYRFRRLRSGPRGTTNPMTTPRRR